MASIDDVRAAFRYALDLDDTVNVDDLAYRTNEAWDSVAHMTLVAELEDRFDVMFSTDDVIEMSSFAIALDTLRRLGADLS